MNFACLAIDGKISKQRFTILLLVLTRRYFLLTECHRAAFAPARVATWYELGQKLIQILLGLFMNFSYSQTGKVG